MSHPSLTPEAKDARRRTIRARRKDFPGLYGERLRAYVSATHDIQTNVHRLEAYHLGLMGAPR